MPLIALADYSEHPQARLFIEKMILEHNFSEEELIGWLSEAKRQESIIKAMSRPAEKSKPWHEYRGIFVTDTRIKRGREFWIENQGTLVKASNEFGVDPAIIVSIIGVETNYGRNVGSYKVIDALTTLAFDYYTSIEKRESRQKFFTIQLEHLLLLAREQDNDPTKLKGSYAGAMGWGQFMPNSYRNYAVDYDNDEFADIWNNPTDAIGSVANYFTEHGWKAGHPVATKAHVDGSINSSDLNKMRRPKLTIGDLIKEGYRPVDKFPHETLALPISLEGKYGNEYWLGLHNFYVIGRYNPRTKYAMAVYQLSQQIQTSICKMNNICPPTS